MKQRWTQLSVLALPLLLFSGAANATLLAPGSTTPITATTESGTWVAGATGTIRICSDTNNCIATTVATATATENVYQEAGGFLDLAYQFTNNTACPPASACDSLEHLTVTSYGNIGSPGNPGNVDVYYLNNLPGAPAPDQFSVQTSPGPTAGNPFTANRSSNAGTVVGFNFTGTNAVAPGEESAIYLIKTDSKIIGPGTFSLLDGGTGSSSAYLSPVPEPGFYGLLAIGLAVAFVFVKYRKQTA